MKLQGSQFSISGYGVWSFTYSCSLYLDGVSLVFFRLPKNMQVRLYMIDYFIPMYRSECVCMVPCDGMAFHQESSTNMALDPRRP